MDTDGVREKRLQNRIREKNKESRGGHDDQLHHIRKE